MKILSLLQPWASLIPAGQKTIETRQWFTPYRGPLAIHASKSALDANFAHLKPDDIEALKSLGCASRKDLPYGKIVAWCILAEVLKTTDIVESALTDVERRHGDYSPNRYGWVLKDIHIVREPIFYIGSLGLRDLPELTEEEVMSESYKRGEAEA